METTYTLGPWNWRADPFDPERFAVYGANVYVDAVGKSIDEARANARLVAAAPDLLAALQRLVHPMADDDDLENAREAIARATGAP
jgi:hypothetical protein